MKRLLFTAILTLSFITIYAQDIIVKKDGSTIMSIVLEVQTDIIKYKKWSNQSGPTYSIKITEILSINYKNGEKDVFNSPSSTPAQIAEKPQECNPISTPVEEWSEESKACNAELIASYNKDYTLNEKYIGNRAKNAKYGIAFAGVTEDSKISVNGCTLCIVPFFNEFRYSASVYLVNSTNKFVYVDLAKCLYNYSRKYLSFEQLYKGETSTTVTSGKNRGSSINLGTISNILGIDGVVGTLSNGINVGGGKSNYTSTTTKNERFLIIPPNSSEKIVSYFGISYSLPSKIKIKNGEIYKINDYSNGAHLIVAYSYDESFEHTYTLEVKTYTRYVVGVSKNMYCDSFNKLKQKCIPNADMYLLFNADRYIKR